MTTLILTRLEERDTPNGWIVAEENVPIGIVSGNTVSCPSGKEYTVRESRLWPAGGDAVAGYNEDAPSVTDLVSGATWELRPNWRAEALKPGPQSNRALDITAALARDYTLEDAEGTMPVRVKLLLAFVATQEAHPRLA